MSRSVAEDQLLQRMNSEDTGHIVSIEHGKFVVRSVYGDDEPEPDLTAWTITEKAFVVLTGAAGIFMIVHSVLKFFEVI